MTDCQGEARADARASDSAFATALRSFDSHERGVLLQWATGSDFELSSQIRRELSVALAPVQVPPRAFVAMDYTLDWLFAATRQYLGAAAAGQTHLWPEDGSLTATGEDVDLLVAWEDDQPRLVLLEAKGFTRWSNKQLLRKVTRLNSIFTESVRAQIDVHFVLTGPKASAGIHTDTWPAWLLKEGRYHFVALPDPGERYMVQRSTADGTPSKAASTHWRAVRRHW